MRTTIFVRILVATLLPVLFVLLIIIITARTVIYMDGTAYAREFVRLAAGQLSDHAAIKIKNASAAQDETVREMTALDFGGADAKNKTDMLLETLLSSNYDLYSAWVSIDPGVFPDGERYNRIYTKHGKGIVGGGGDYELFGDLEASPWYSAAISMNSVYADINEVYDFKTGEGPINVFIISQPLVAADGRTVGCLGMAIRYEDIFLIDNLINKDAERMMLVSVDGDILYSLHNGDTGGKLWDYGFKNIHAASKALREKTVWHEETRSPSAGERLFVCLHPIEMTYTGQTVYLYKETPTTGLYSSFYSSMEVIISTGMIGMLLLAFCVFFSTRNIVRHVKRITDSFYHVANNTAGVTLKGEHIPMHQTNVLELDILQTALVSMIVQLRNAHGSQLKAVEAKVENEKLIASAQAKTNFFAAVSHEIRTPMNAVIGISEIMLNEGGLTEAQEKRIGDIKMASDALLNIINDILDISKMETGKMELHPDHYNFIALIDNITSLATRLSEDAGLRFEYIAEKELPLCLYGDSVRMRQVLLNLIGNAVKFTRQGCITLRVQICEHEIQFDIQDTGIGIKESDLDSVFESFRRAENKLNHEVAGTGLGLSISKSLVEIMGGRILVESVYGKGSTFKVILPLVLGDEKKMQRKRPGLSAKYSSSLRMLVVDDNEVNLSVSSGLLRSIHGINCDTALSGLEAIAKVQAVDYDMIFMDHMMPEMDGIETTQRIRALGGRHKDIPIIALTANVVIGAQKELLNGGMDGFLAKPIQSQKLQEILEEWIPEDKRLPIDKNETSPAAVVTESGVMSDISVKLLLEDEGIDTLAGMGNVGFDEDVYLQSLKLLRDRLPHVTQMLGELLEAKNIREFHIHVHGLKGSLASVGAIPLSKDLQKIEAAALDANADYCHTLLQPLLTKLLRMHEALCKALPEPDIDASGRIDGDWEIASFERLRSALERYDYDAVVSELDNILSENHSHEKSKTLSRIKLLIESFDYPGAIALINSEITGDSDIEK